MRASSDYLPAGFDISTMSKHLQARDQFHRHVQRKQTAKAEERRRRALKINQTLKRNYVETGRAVMTRLKQLEEEVTTLRKTAMDLPTPASVAEPPSLIATRVPATVLPSYNTKSSTVLPLPTSPQEIAAPTTTTMSPQEEFAPSTPTPTQSNTFTLLQPSPSLPRDQFPSMASALDSSQKQLSFNIVVQVPRRRINYQLFQSLNVHHTYPC